MHIFEVFRVNKLVLFFESSALKPTTTTPNNVNSLILPHLVSIPGTFSIYEDSKTPHIRDHCQQVYWYDIRIFSVYNTF